MYSEKIIKNTAQFIKDKFSNEATGHDWWHIYRVWNTSKKIAATEKADLFIVELAALLHDLEDYKLQKTVGKTGGSQIREWLLSQQIDKKNIQHICEIIENLSYKGAGVSSKMNTIEGQIVQDADRLDAMGAIGIARAFAYGGSCNRSMYNPEIKPVFHTSFEEYKNSQGPTINHFYEKLLLLKNLMNTNTGKLLAEERHLFMEEYLKRFFEEWES